MDFDARTDNRTPLEVRCLPMDDRHGRPVLVAVAKLGWRVSPRGAARIASPPIPIRLDDEYEGEGSGAFLVRPSDWVDEKPGTDVVVLGTARPPEGKPVSEMEVSVRVGPLAKQLRVTGARAYQAAALGGLAAGPAARLAPTAIRYDLAFGGFDERGDGAHDPRNPAGVGFADLRAKRPGGPAPRIELARGEGREPAGFGPIAPHWAGRVEHVGTRDAAWQRSRAPVPPLDFDPRFNLVAHPDLRSPTPLSPDEPVEIRGMTPEGIWRFKLPSHAPRFSSVLRGDERQHPTHLDTFLVDVDESVVELVWRAAIPLPRKAQELSAVVVRVEPAIPLSLLEHPHPEAEEPS